TLRQMFNLSSFNQDIGGWILNEDVDLMGLFDFSEMDCRNYSNTLIGWSENNPGLSDRTLGANGLQYGINAENARDLLDDRDWTITGDSPSGTTCTHPFITTWKTDNPGPSGNNQITIPTTGTG